MTDKALQNAKNKRNQLSERRRTLHEELANLDQEIGEIDRFIRTWHAFAEDDTQGLGTSPATTGGNKSGHSDTKPKATKNTKKEIVAAVTKEVILQNGEPIMRDELYRILIERGLVIEGKDPQMVLSTMLWRMADVIARLPTGGYWPADTPNEQIGFDPIEYRDAREAQAEKHRVNTSGNDDLLGPIQDTDVFG